MFGIRIPIDGIRNRADALGRAVAANASLRAGLAVDFYKLRIVNVIAKRSGNAN